MVAALLRGDLDADTVASRPDRGRAPAGRGDSPGLQMPGESPHAYRATQPWLRAGCGRPPRLPWAASGPRGLSPRMERIRADEATRSPAWCRGGPGRRLGAIDVDRPAGSISRATPARAEPLGPGRCLLREGRERPAVLGEPARGGVAAARAGTGAAPRSCSARECRRGPPTGSAGGSGNPTERGWHPESPRSGSRGAVGGPARAVRMTASPRRGPGRTGGQGRRITSSAEPSSTILPRYITAIRSAMTQATERSWVMNR